jgi:hypothetical protein
MQVYDLIDEVSVRFADLGFHSEFKKLLAAIEKIDADMEEAIAEREDPQADCLREIAQANIAAMRRIGA